MHITPMMLLTEHRTYIDSFRENWKIIKSVFQTFSFQHFLFIFLDEFYFIAIFKQSNYEMEGFRYTQSKELDAGFRKHI